MLAREITYKDFDDKTVTETFYFGLNPIEATEMVVNGDANLIMQAETIIAARDNETLLRVFKDLIKKSVGRRSGDGKRFEKSKSILKDFTQSNAYGQLFTDLITDADFATEFFNGIMPADMLAQIEVNSAAKSDATHSREELLAMSDEDFITVAGKKIKNMSVDHQKIAFERKAAAIAAA